MIRSNNIVIMAVPIALVIGAIGGFGSFDLLQDNSLDTTGISYGMLGHVTAIVRDANGEITGYSQGDNLVLDGGEECISKLVFLGADNTESIDTECSGAITSGFGIIGLVNGTSCSGVTASSQDPTQGCNVGNGLIDGLINNTDTSLNRVQATTISFSDDGANSKTTLQEVFTNSGSSNTVLRSVIMNSTSTGADFVILASQDFGSAAVVSNGGTLTIIWELTTGATTTFD